MKKRHLSLKLFYSLVFLLLSTTSFAQFRVIGYIPTWGGNLNDVQYKKLTHINYAFLIPNANGTYQNPDDPTRLRNLVTLAHANGVKVMISVGGGGGGDAFKTIVTSAALRTTFVNNMISFANQYNIDGIDIDWEFPNTGTEANNFLLLMQELYTATHNNGKLCTIAVIAYGGTSILNGVFNAVDFINIMAYDENSYDHSTYDLGVKSVNYWVGRGLPANKAVLGVPFYGRDNCCSYKTVGYNDILTMGGSPTADTYNNKVGYNGIPTMKKKTAYAIQSCGGIMIWSLDTDAKGANSLLSAIDEVVVANTNPVPDNLAKGKPVTVSSTEVNTTISTVAANITDGSYSTRWGSLFADPQWVSIDLGAPYNVNRVKISWEAAFASTYQIQISSNGTDWTNLKSITGNTTATNDQTGLSGAGRYVRIYGTARATTYGYSIYEVEVYGTPIESPYTGTAITIPGKFEAENYDFGGEGLAYHDSETANQGGAYRTGDGVDIQATTDAGGGYNIGYTATGEWLKYMVNVTATGVYDIAFRNAGTAAGAIRLEVDGTDVTGSVTLPSTGAYQTWATTTKTGVSLTAGAHTFRVYVVTGGFNLNYITVTAQPNKAPTVSITAPTSGTTFTAPATVNIAATAADADGTVSKVEFFNGNTKIGEDVTSPYTYSWTGIAAGTYSITAKATDNSAAVTTSSAVSITVNAPANVAPTVSITAPTTGTTFTDPATVNIAATAADTDGSISKVEFFNGNTKIGEDATSPYTYSWTGIAAGTYSITAKATDNSAAVTTSSAVSITVNAPANVLPTVSITTPTTGATFTATATVSITATAADADGTVSKVEFYNGNTKIGEDATSPYTYSWTGIAAGNYSITAKATDNSAAVTTSSAVSITVNAPANVAPTVSITAPTTGTTFTDPATVNIAATAADTDGSISKVEFFNGNTKIGEDATSPYTYSWINVAVGTYELTVKAYDNLGAVTTSTAIPITVNPELTTGINDQLSTTSASFYPNPAKDLISFSETVESVVIYNLSGQVIEQPKLTSAKQINLTAYPSGIYLIRLNTANESRFEKLVKE